MESVKLNKLTIYHVFFLFFRLKIKFFLFDIALCYCFFYKKTDKPIKK